MVETHLIGATSNYLFSEPKEETNEEAQMDYDCVNSCDPTGRLRTKVHTIARNGYPRAYGHTHTIAGNGYPRAYRHTHTIAGNGYPRAYRHTHTIAGNGYSRAHAHTHTIARNGYF